MGTVKNESDELTERKSAGSVLIPALFFVSSI